MCVLHGFLFLFDVIFICRNWIRHAKNWSIHNYWHGCSVDRDTGHIELLTAEMFARQISGLSAHGTHSAYSRTPTGATGSACTHPSYNDKNPPCVFFFNPCFKISFLKSGSHDSWLTSRLTLDLPWVSCELIPDLLKCIYVCPNYS